MREIKFRAKARFNGTIGSDQVWVHSSFLNLKADRLTLGGKRCQRETLGQYTGLKDKNRKEIYEGDVLDIKGATCNEYDFRGIVSFYDGTFCLAAMRQTELAKKHGYLDRVRFWKDGCHDHHSLEMIESFEMEIIGNTYENPKLSTETNVSQK